jgi:hypothetical protein
MGDDDEFEWEELPVRPGDPKTDEAKAAIMEHVAAYPRRVFYSRQLEVLLEGRFFHWITNRAVRELVAEGALRAEERALGPQTFVRFLVRPDARYFKRAIARSLQVIRRYSRYDVARACGDHAEMMYLGALAERGFVCVGRNTNSYRERQWTASNEDLDYIVEREGLGYGVEVKNTLDYIEREVMWAKMRICEHLGLAPVFIVRASPKSYTYEIYQAGGFVVIFQRQMYPFGCRDLVEEIQRELGLPVESPRFVPAGQLDRLVRWHEKRRVV